MKTVDMVFQALSGFLVLAVLVVLFTISGGLSDSTLPFLLATGASLSAMISLFLKVRTYRDTKWGLYLYIIAIILMVANSFANASIRGSRTLALTLSGITFIVATIATTVELRTERVSIAEDSGCVIKLLVTGAFIAQVVIVVIFFTFHSMWE